MKWNHYQVSKLIILRVFIHALIFSCVTCFTPCLFASNAPLGTHPNFHHLMFGVNDTVGEVLSIHQDKYGFIWLGGRNGLARYDGYRFYHYKNDPNDPHSLSNNVVRDVFEDSQGELWIASESGGVMRFNRDLDNFHVYQPKAGDKNSISSLVIWKIYEDSQNNLWVAGRNGLNLYNRKEDNFSRFLSNSAIANYPIVDMKEYDVGKYLIGTELGGLFFWEKAGGLLTHYVTDANIPSSLPHMLVRSIHVDSNKKVWLGTELGLSTFDPMTGKFSRVDLSAFKLDRLALPILEIFEDRNGVFWLSTDGGGLLYLYPETGEIGQYLHSSDRDSALSSAYPRTVYQDVNGDYWIGAFPKGVNYFDQSNTFFKTYRNFARDAAGAYSNDIWAFAEDDKGNLWIGVDNAGLVYFDREAGTITRNYNGIPLEGSFQTAAVLSIFQDDRNYLWLGTWGKGLYRIDLKTGAVKNYYPNEKKSGSISFENIWRIYQDSQGRLWIATNGGGVNLYNYEHDTFKHYKPEVDNLHSLQHSHVWAIYEDKKGRIWFGTSSGADVYEPSIDGFRHYIYNPNDKQGLSHNWVMGFLEDSKGRFWISTAGGGVNLLNADGNSFTHIRQSDGLADDAVYGVLEDQRGNLWFSTRGGLSFYNPGTQTYKSYTSRNWLQDEQFHMGSYLKLKSGELVFGGARGFSLFNPESLKSNEYSAPIHLTEARLFGEKIDVSDHRTILDRNITQANEITLDHTQSMFSLSFSLLNYRVYEDNLYEYRLKGFDSAWIGPTKEKSVTYTNLNPGRYEFQVRGYNNDGVESLNTRKLKITVLPAPWWTWWAKSIYLGIVLGFLGVIYFALKRKIQAEHQLNERLQEVDCLKDEFLANTSHELRTPLNGIIGMAEALIDGSHGKIGNGVLQDLEIIVSSGRRLSNLVNDILDFSKARHHELALNFKRVDLTPLINLVVLQCKPLLKNNISIVIKTVTQLPNVYADESRLQQILHNLLGNAIKFTEQGSITISTEVVNHFVKVNIQDTGVGIDNNDIAIIFNSFEQLHSPKNSVKSGTGLGLAVTKKLVELHGGEISVNSKKGQGATFSFTIPVTNLKQFETKSDRLGGGVPGILGEETKTGMQVIKKNVFETKEGLLPVFEPEKFKNNCKILVVDDENVNRQVIRFFLLKHGYTVYEACDGEEAVHVISEGFKPDLVLLDIMMPKMTGYQACDYIRKQYDEFALPVLFVSAKSQEREVSLVYEHGGTDFVNKPINKDELLIKVARYIKLSKERR